MALSIDDLFNPFFDKQRPVRHYVRARPGMVEPSEEQMEQFSLHGDRPDLQELAIEGVTFTDNFAKIGYTYYEQDGLLVLNYWNEKDKKNIRLLAANIQTGEDFEKQLKKADKKLRKLYGCA